MRAVARRAAVLVLVLCVCGVHAVQLHPNCGSEEYAAQAPAKSNGTIMRLPGQGDVIDVDCVAHEVISVKQGSRRGNDYCLPQVDGVYSYNLVLRATSVSDPQRVQYYNIADTMGASVTNLTIRTDTQSIFDVVLHNPSNNSRCTLKARLRIAFALRNASAPASATPSLDSITPLMLSTDADRASYFVLHHATPEAAHNAVSASVWLVNATQTCAADASNLTLSHDPHLPSTLTTPTSASLLSAHYAKLYRAGVYRVCYHASNGENVTVTTPAQLALVIVYTTNPGFYEIVADAAPAESVHVGDPFMIRFHGSSLDTRVFSDSAKLVYIDARCDSGAPAGGVPVSKQLQPSNTYGSRFTQTTWNLTIKKPGTYRICYRRIETHSWIEVPPNDGVPAPPSRPSTAPSGDSSATPVPTNPANKDECPMAPESTPEAPWVNYHGIELVLAERKAAPEFLHKLSDTLCIPRSALYPVRLNHTAQGNQIIYFTIDCESVLVNGKQVCSTHERYNYIVYLAASQSTVLKDIGVTAAKGLTSMIAFDDDPVVVVHRYSTIGLIVVSLILFAAAALALVAVRRYRENRAYFVQFGLDENDINDMYEVNEASHEVPTAAPRAQSGKPVRGAVIEVEE